MLNKDLLKILACPVCKLPVTEVNHSLICTNALCRRRYDIKDNIPVMLIDGSEVMSEASYREALQS
ncbi:Trm112 family protein [bacterium]|nr:MAG: Trm112 family protein [bacterium]